MTPKTNLQNESKLPQWNDALDLSSAELVPARCGVAGERNSPPCVKMRLTFIGERPEAFFSFLVRTGNRPCWISMSVEGLEAWNPGPSVTATFGKPKLDTPLDPTGKTQISTMVKFEGEIASNLLRLIDFRAQMIDGGDLSTAFVEAKPIQAKLSESPSASGEVQEELLP